MKTWYCSLPVGLCLAMSAGSTMAADMDSPIFQEPVRYDQVAEPEYVLRNEALSGFVEGGFGYGRGDVEGFDADGTSWALRGTVNGRLDPHWNLQIDGAFSRTSVEDVNVDALTGAAHAYYRQPNAFAVGAFVQGSRFSSAALDPLSSLGLDDYALDIVGGGEAAFFTKSATFYGQLGFGRASYSGYDADHLLAKAGARLYATDNLRFDVEGALNRFSVSGGDADIYSISGIGYYRLAQTPITFFGGYRYDHGSLDIGGTTVGSVEVNNLVAGLRFSFGTESLKQEERDGALWSPTPISF